jgi:hypothetical protein
MAGYGWARDVANDRLDVEVAGTTVLQATTTALTLPSDVSSGLTVTAGGVTVTAGGLTVTAGGIYVAAGRITETLTVVDDDTQSMTLAAADILAGINVHTSVTGAGTITCDTAANIVAGVPLSNDNQCVVSYFINDGTQTDTFAADGGATVTIADAGNTILTNEAAVLLWRRTAATTVTLYIVSS